MIAAKATVLTVWASPDTLRTLNGSVSGFSFEIVNVSETDSAIFELKRRAFDVILLELPGNGRHGAAPTLQKFLSARKPETPIIIVGDCSGADGSSLDCQPWVHRRLARPFTPEMLINAVVVASEHGRLKQENIAIKLMLQRSERMYRYMLNSSPDIVFMLDSQNRFKFLNRKSESMLGYKEEELLGEHWSVLVWEEDKELGCHALNDRSRTCANVELRFRCKDPSARPRHVDIHLFPIELNPIGTRAFRQTSTAKRLMATYGVARDVTERKRAERIIEYQAYHDLLTGLPNRALFKDRLRNAISQARRSGRMLGVVCVDVDRFKFVNDTLGHATGDQLLRVVSRRFRSCMREGDTLARTGGNEFKLVLPQIRDQEDAVTVAQKLIGTLGTPVALRAHEFFLSASLGITLFPEDGETADRLIKNAELAMNTAKQSRKGGYERYAPHMDRTLSRHLSLESELRKAMTRGQFRVFYQPQVDARTGSIVGMEALIRWDHPTRGLLAPMEFIPCAENTGLIVPIGKWLLRSVCAEITRWRQLGLPQVRVAVNLSALQVEHPEFIDVTFGVLNESGLTGDSLEVEITENLIMKDVESCITKLKKLSHHGITVAIDDFGTGYSSLSYLQKLPIDTIKIDRSFVQEITAAQGNTSIVTAIVAMANGLGLNIIAEGVETALQRERLMSLGCHRMQGFFYSQPLAPTSAMRFLSQNLAVPCAL